MNVEIKGRFVVIQYIVTVIFFSYSASSLRCQGGCCADYYMDHYRNDCIPCGKGYYGLNCASRCPLSFYGHRCILKCNCSNDLCHFQNGCLHLSTDGNIKTEHLTLRSTISTFDLIPEESFKQDDVNKPVNPCEPKYKKNWTKTKISMITATIFLFVFAFFLFGAYLKGCHTFQERGRRQT